MNNPYDLSDEELYGGEPTLEEQEIERLKKKIEKLEEENETLKDCIKTAVERIKVDIELNEASIKNRKDYSKVAIGVFEYWLQFDKKLLESLNYDS